MRLLFFGEVRQCRLYVFLKTKSQSWQSGFLCDENAFRLFEILPLTPMSEVLTSPNETETESAEHVPLQPRRVEATTSHISDEVSRKKEELLRDEPHELVGFGD